MATGRTLERHTRFYVGGYDLSGVGRSVGPLEVAHDEVDMTAWPDPVKGYLRGHTQVNVGVFNALFDNTETTGIHTVLGTAGGERTVLVAKGIRAAPAAGDPAFCGQFTQAGYQASDDGGALTVSVPFSGWSVTAASLLYAGAWGVLLHANGAETGANTAVGIDDRGGATALGGYMLYQVLAGNGTATIKVQDAATNTNPSFADITGATSGVINCATPSAGIVALGTAAAVRQYLRWQVVLGTATSVTFALAFVRG